MTCPICFVGSPAVEVPKCPIPHFQFHISVEAICEAGEKLFAELHTHFPEMFKDLDGNELAEGDYSRAARGLCTLLEWGKLDRDRARKDAEYWRKKWYDDQFARMTGPGLEAQLDDALKKL